MATKKATKISNLARLNKAKSSLKKINNDIIDSSFEVLKSAVKNGEKWQKLSSKLLKKGTPLKNKQVQMFLETAEAIKGQFESGADRLKDITGFDPKIVEDLKEKVAQNPLAQKAEKATMKIAKELTETFEDAKDKFEDIREEVKEKLEEVTTNVKGKIAKTPNKEKVATKNEDIDETFIAADVNVDKDNLKVIHKIGPKMEGILNKSGILTYAALAKMSLKKIEEVLLGASVNTKLYSLSDWKAQAKLAAKGDLEGVAQLIKEIKLKK